MQKVSAWVIACALFSWSTSAFGLPIQFTFEGPGLIEGIKSTTVSIIIKVTNTGTDAILINSASSEFPFSSLGDFTPKSPDVVLSAGGTSSISIGSFHFTSEEVSKTDNQGFGFDGAGVTISDDTRNIIDGTGFKRTGSFPVHVTPEPATLLLFGTTAAGLGLARWQQRRRKQQPQE